MSNNKKNVTDMKKGSIDRVKAYWSANPLKIYSHLPKLYEWYMGKDIYPISIEIGITSLCNHDCVWCSVKTKAIHSNKFITDKLLDQFVSDIKDMDVRSVIISGSGEQTLHPHFRVFIKNLKSIGVHIGVNTNGSNLTEQICEDIANYVTWIRVSLDASSEEARGLIHGAKDLHKAVKGLKHLVRLKKEKEAPISIGTQMVVCPENDKEIASCVKLSASIGADYHQIKPVSYFHEYYPGYKGDVKKYMRDNLEIVKGVVKDYAQNGFMINVRYDQFLDYTQENSDWDGQQTCITCLTTFSPYIEADGTVWFCVDKKGYTDYLLGNLNENTLKEIWHGKKRKASLDFIKKHPCTHICRNTPLNEFLYDIKHPSPFHDFF